LRGDADVSRFQPDGRPTVTPRLFTPDVAGLVAFLKAVFDAEGELHTDMPVDLRIGDSIVTVSDGGGVRGASAATLYVYVADTDQACRHALAAGARSIEAPADVPWGDRRAIVQDPWGNSWQIATHRGP
jgi:PhnB protein